MKRQFLLCCGILLVSFTGAAQRTIIASGDYTYYVPKHIALEQAERIALERAQLQILADEFGTIIESVSTTQIANSNGQSNVSTSTIGSSEVKGEWLETIGDPIYTTSYEGGMLVLHVKIKGRVREILTAPIDFKVKVLCNGIEDKFERSSFFDGDDMYLSFASPINGYLTVYLFNGNDNVYCLLPYQRQTEGMIAIKANQRYIFFSQDQTPDTIEKQLVDEYILTADSESEFNRIYIIFSPHRFYKAADKQGSTSESPRFLSFQEFQKWLAKVRRSDNSMQLVVKDIIINKHVVN